MGNNYYKIAAAATIIVLLAGAVIVILPHKLWSKATREPAEFIIQSGQSSGTTARLLAERNLIINRYIFIAYAVISGNEKQFKAGRYLIPPSVSTYNLVKIFSSGQAKSDDMEITIPEGTNIADTDRIFTKAGLTREGDILSYNFKHGSALVQEGFLFPDTYRFKRPEAGQAILTEEIIKKMRDNFEQKTNELFAGRFTGEGGAEREYQIIIVASILEKEVRTEEDMRWVAGIIQKRLELDRPLELDATVAYGVCYPDFLSGRYCDVSLANIVDNIAVDSAYNTYKRKGLPVGPISNPGSRSIKATLNPQLSDYLFYLSAKDGTTVFSRTAAEHEKARQKYLLK